MTFISTNLSDNV